MLNKLKGFTLIELMIALVIAGLLAYLAYPSYLAYARKSNRVDGTSTLMAMQLAQEKYRFSNTQYGTLAQVWGGVTTSSKGYYQLAISNVSGSTYTLTATAQGSQANDNEGSVSCTPLVITVNGASVTKTPAACW